MIKSPFYIIPNFLSVKHCDAIVSDLGFFVPDMDEETDKAILMQRHHEKNEILIYEKLMLHMNDIEKHYDFSYAGTERITFEFYAPGADRPVHCENSDFLRNKWVQTRNRTITGVVFFQNYMNPEEIFDQFEDVYGGRLEFPTWNFGFNPIKGTLVLFPSDPHFINGTSEVIAGNLITARLHISSKTPWFYDPAKFPGGYDSWFKDYTS